MACRSVYLRHLIMLGDVLVFAERRLTFIVLFKSLPCWFLGRNIKICFRFPSRVKTEMAQAVEIPPPGREIHICHASPMPGNARSHVPCNHYIFVIVSGYSDFSTRKIETTLAVCHWCICLLLLYFVMVIAVPRLLKWFNFDSSMEK